MSADWFKEQPSEGLRSRVLASADREIETLSHLPRRSFFSDFFSDFVSSWRGATLTAGWASGMAAIAAVWLVSKNEGSRNEIARNQVSGSDLELEFQKVTVDEFNLVADLELFEELDLLESISEEDLERGETES